jgi:hypothetical protein
MNKVEAPIMDKGPIVDFIFNSHTFLRHISKKVIDNCLKLKLSGIGSSILYTIPLASCPNREFFKFFLYIYASIHGGWLSAISIFQISNCVKMQLNEHIKVN